MDFSIGKKRYKFSRSKIFFYNFFTIFCVRRTKKKYFFKKFRVRRPLTFLKNFFFIYKNLFLRVMSRRRKKLSKYSLRKRFLGLNCKLVMEKRKWLNRISLFQKAIEIDPQEKDIPALFSKSCS